MRILFSFAGGVGHFAPLVPIARAAVAAGHTVTFAGRRSVITAIEAEGFTAIRWTSIGAIRRRRPMPSRGSWPRSTAWRPGSRRFLNYLEVGAEERI